MVLPVIAVILLSAGQPVMRDPPIHKAATRGDVEVVKKLLDADPSLLQSQDDSKRTPLHRAARAGYIEVVQLLIECGADVNAEAYNGFKPLDVTSNGEVARALLKAGADPMIGTGWRQSSLQDAVHDGNVEVVDAILEAGYQLDLVSLIELGRIDDAIALIKRDPQALALGGGTVDLWGNRTPLGLACAGGHLELAKACLEAGADPNAGTMMPNMGGDSTPVTAAVWANKPELLRLLFAHGAVARGVGGRMYSNIIEYAMDFSSLKILFLLIEHGGFDDMLIGPDWWDDVMAIYSGSAGGDLVAIRNLLDEPTASYDAHALYHMMFMAAIGGHADVVAEIRKHGAPDSFLIHVLMGQVRDVAAAIGQSPDVVDAADPWLHRPALAWAVSQRRHDVAKILLQHGADANAVWTRPTTNLPLFVETTRAAWGMESEACLGIAVWNEDLEMCRLLIENGASAAGPGKHGWPLLKQALVDRNAELVRLLLESGADPNPPAQLGQTPLLDRDLPNDLREMLLAFHKNDLRSDEELGEIPGVTAPTALGYSGAEVGKTVVDFYTACALGDVEYVRKVIRESPDIVNRILDRRTHDDVPLAVACLHGQLGVVEVLLENGAVLNSDYYMDAPVIAAAESGSVDLIKMLVERGADLNASTFAGTAMHRAAMFGRLEIMQYLVDHGFDVNDGGEWGGPGALGCAASWNQVEAVDWLLQHGARINQRAPGSGDTALHCAAGRGALAAAKQLLAAGADPSIRNHLGHTAFDAAVRRNGYESASERLGMDRVARLLAKKREESK